jgi:hypothetical protein
MGLVIFVVVAEAVLVVGTGVLRQRARVAARREVDRFRAAAEEARRLAHHARIVDASVAELSELVVEQCLAELGLGAAPGQV